MPNWVIVRQKLKIIRSGSIFSRIVNGYAIMPVSYTHLAQAGYASNQVPNPDLKWEANKTFNLGMDFGFLNQRVTFSPEFYINRSSNLLLAAKLPYSSGYQNMIINAGETQDVYKRQVMGYAFSEQGVSISVEHCNESAYLMLPVIASPEEKVEITAREVCIKKNKGVLHITCERCV